MPDVVSGLLSVGGSLLSSELQGDAAQGAADTQAQAALAGIEEQRRQFNQIRELLQPYVQAGAPALQQQQALLGLRGADAQRQAIQGIESSPMLQERIRQGETALLQNASATGGLRGGNVQSALAQFRPAILAEEIERQYGRLGGLTTLGQNSAVGVGNAGMQTGGNIANLLQQQGAAQAGGVLGAAQGTQNAIGGITQGLGAYYGLTGRSPFSGFGGTGASVGGLGSLAGTSSVAGPGGAMVPVI